jgi:hypothetical protein
MKNQASVRLSGEAWRGERPKRTLALPFEQGV